MAGCRLSTNSFKFDIPQSVIDDPSTLIVESDDTTMSVESFTQSALLQ